VSRDEAIRRDIDSEDSTQIVRTTFDRRAVEISVCGLEESARRLRAVSVSMEIVKLCECSVGSDPEQRPDLSGPAGRCRAVEITVAGLNERTSWVDALQVSEAVQPLDGARRSHLENRTEAALAALRRRPVQIPIVGLNQGSSRVGAIRVGEAMNRRQTARRIDPEDRSEPAVASPIRRPVEVPVARQNQAALTCQIGRLWLGWTRRLAGISKRVDELVRWRSLSRCEHRERQHEKADRPKADPGVTRFLETLGVLSRHDISPFRPRQA